MSSSYLVTIIIVNFNGGELLLRSVRQAFSSDVSVEVIISDNASVDNSLELLEEEFSHDSRLTIIRNSSNLGFASANNIALKKAEGDFFLFLNPDCLIHPDTIRRLVQAFYNDEQAGMVGCRVLNPDGTEQKGCRRRVPTPWRSFVRVLGLSHFTQSTEWLQGFDMSSEPLPDKPVPVDAISGSLMLVSRKALDDIGPMDEGYFLHCEDLDWCMRFNLKGYKVLFVPDVEVIHHQGHSSKPRPVRVMWHMHKGMMRFYNKFFLRRYPWPMVIVVSFGVWFRFLILVGKHFFHALADFICGIIRRVKNLFSSSSDDNIDPSFLQFKSNVNSPEKRRVLVLGARSQIGHFLLPRLINEGYPVAALSRKKVGSADISSLDWFKLDLESEDELSLPDGTESVVSLAPVWLLATRINEMADQGIQRLIFFSSTSFFKNQGWGRTADSSFVSRIGESETRLINECNKRGINWTLFRPTHVYGCGMDTNVFSIARFVRRFRFFTLVGSGNYLLQPVHADDLADACIKALNNESTFQQEYHLSGGEILSFTSMVGLLFELLGRRKRIFFVSRSVLRSMRRVVAVIPGLRQVNPALIDRLEQDDCIDHSQAIMDFSYSPRGFLETSFYRQSFTIPQIAKDEKSELKGLNSKKVLVTGAGGFIGFSLCRYLVDHGCEVNAILRDIRQLHDLRDKLKPIIVDDLCEVHNWDEMLGGVDVVVHLAGYVHERAGDLSEQAKLQCKRLNIDVTRRLASAAASAGVKRFVYVSSIKVHGESSNQDESVTEFIQPYPEGSYAKSKLAAEGLLRDVESSSQMEVVIVRPPLVYGPGVQANFLRLMKLVEKGIPLPLAAVDNRRSFIYLENLVDMLALSIVHPDAAGQTFLVSDSEGVSTPALINMLADGMGVTPHLFPISVEVMQVLAAVGGERSSVDRLVQSLVINSSHVRNTLNWQPPYSMEQGIRNTIYWYQQLYDPVRSSQSPLSAYASGW